MIDFLKDCNVDDDTLEEMYKKYSTELFDLNCNKREIVKIIEYLRNLGITNVSDLLVYETGLFYKSLNWIENKFSSIDTVDLVSKINDNYEEIEIIFD